MKLGARDRRDAARVFALTDPEGPTMFDAPTSDFAPDLLGGEFLGLSPQPFAGPEAGQASAEREDYTLHDSALEQWRFERPSHARSDLRALVREVLDGTRPDDMTMVKRAWLTLAASVAIGFCFFAIAAGVGVLFGIGSFLRWLAN